jgi:hypothetical protein
MPAWESKFISAGCFRRKAADVGCKAFEEVDSGALAGRDDERR